MQSLQLISTKWCFVSRARSMFTYVYMYICKITKPYMLYWGTFPSSSRTDCKPYISCHTPVQRKNMMKNHTVNHGWLTSQSFGWVSNAMMFCFYYHSTAGVGHTDILCLSPLLPLFPQFLPRNLILPPPCHVFGTDPASFIKRTTKF